MLLHPTVLKGAAAKREWHDRVQKFRDRRFAEVLRSAKAGTTRNRRGGDEYVDRELERRTEAAEKLIFCFLPATRSAGEQPVRPEGPITSCPREESSRADVQLNWTVKTGRAARSERFGKGGISAA